MTALTPHADYARRVMRTPTATVLEHARRGDLVVVPWHPFARRWMRNHPNASVDVTVDRRTLAPPASDLPPHPANAAADVDGPERR